MLRDKRESHRKIRKEKKRLFEHIPPRKQIDVDVNNLFLLEEFNKECFPLTIQKKKTNYIGVREIRILFSLQRVWCNFFSHDRILLIYFFISSTLLVLIGIVFLEEKIYFSIFVQHFLGAFKTSIEKPIFFFFYFPFNTLLSCYNHFSQCIEYIFTNFLCLHACMIGYISGFCNIKEINNASHIIQGALKDFTYWCK